ncbi:putative transcription regulator Homeodomain-LIKE family [Helianthus annuus]|nr:putative transcription regulator Homeodomain-LIKE family [Helianthus annuus]
MTENERLQLMNAKGEFCVVGCETDNGLVPVPVPCSSREECWSAIEHDSFILGLYIFGKNLRVVNKFVGDKGMPNVISYYYGKFYRSGEYQNWSMYRKKRIKKSLPGKKIFRGWRLQELLSRLLSNVTDECKASLTQVIKIKRLRRENFRLRSMCSL